MEPHFENQIGVNREKIAWANGLRHFPVCNFSRRRRIKPVPEEAACIVYPVQSCSRLHAD